MNSLPFISHHLFVEAVANESRARARPARYDRPSGELAAPATIVPFELIDDQEPLPVGATFPLRTSVPQARS
jgi:hypothetical protein